MKMIGIVLLVVGILLVVALLPINFLGNNWPTTGLVGSILCGSGNHLEVTFGVNENATRLRNSIQGMSACVNETGDVTNDSISGTLLIISMVPGVVLGTIGVALMNAGNMLGGFGGMKEMAEISKVPEVKAQLDALLEDFKAGRVSYEDYAAKSKNIIENYKARQAAS